MINSSIHKHKQKSENKIR